MKTTVVAGLVIIGATMVPACKKTDNPLMSDGSGTNLVLNSSFESNGKPSLDGWQYADSSGIDFPADVPSGGGGISLRMSAVWFAPIRYEGIWTTVPIEPGRHIYAFTCWAKKSGIGGAMLIFPPGAPLDSALSATVIFVADSVWTEYGALDTVNVSSPDSIIVFLGRGATEITFGYTSYDLCTFELIR